MSDGSRPPAIVRNMERTRKRVANMIRHRQEQIARHRGRIGPTTQGAALSWMEGQIASLEAQITSLRERDARMAQHLKQLNQEEDQ